MTLLESFLVSKNQEFRKGDVIAPEDIPRLRLLGKEHVYVWEQVPAMFMKMKLLCAWPGMLPDQGWHGQPNQGKVNLIAQHDGLLKIRVEQLNMINRIENLAFVTLHNNQVVKRTDSCWS